jgi:hypothetical protein
MRLTITLSAAVTLAACSAAGGPPASLPNEADGAAPVLAAGVDASAAPEIDASVPRGMDATASADVVAPPPAEGDAGADAPPDAVTDARADADTDAAPLLGIDCTTDDAADEAPARLGCSGLYDDWPARHVAPANAAYDPGFHLWSDGADKSRWIRLPEGTHIDTSNMDEWTFPVGTKVWKEFRLSGAPVETRLLWKRGVADWVYATYAWTHDGSDATRLDGGATNVFGTTYEIPARDACVTCHAGRIDRVLGFEAVSLASPRATGLTLSALVARGLVTSAPSRPLAVPGAGTPAEGALSWLHANCGTACHNRSPEAFAGVTGLFMRLDVATLGSVQATDAWQTAVGQPSGFQPSPDAGFSRIAPGDVAHSAIPFRDGTRDDQGQSFQMPPIDTHLVDTADVAAVKAWIAAMSPDGG